MVKSNLAESRKYFIGSFYQMEQRPKKDKVNLVSLMADIETENRKSTK